MSIRPPRLPRPHRHFTPFYSVAEESLARLEQQSRGTLDGGMAAACERIVSTPGADLPYKVLLTRNHRAEAAHPFATMRDAEAFIRRNSPATTSALSTLYDRDAE